MRRLSYDALRLAYDDRADKSSSFFFHIVDLCREADHWWEELDKWWDRMDKECRKAFMRFLHEQDLTQMLFHIIDRL